MRSVCEVADIRRTVGIGSDTIEDDDVSRLIQEATIAVEGYLNTAVYPKTVINSLDNHLGNGSEIIFLDKMPVLNILAVKIDGETVSPQYVKFYRGGKIVLTNSAEESSWDDNPQANVIKYTYGMVKDNEDVQTVSTAAITTPATSTSMAVSSSAEFEVNDWVRIYGMDGYSEVSKVTAKDDATHATVDIYFPHENGSIVMLQEPSKRLKRFVEIITSLMMVARIVGESYTDIVGYGLEGFSIQKGEPYTQWRETYNQLNKEKLELKKNIRPMAVVV